MNFTNVLPLNQQLFPAPLVCQISLIEQYTPLPSESVWFSVGHRPKLQSLAGASQQQEVCPMLSFRDGEAETAAGNCFIKYNAYILGVNLL